MILNKLNSNKGFTLIEILLVVGFMTLAGIGVYVVYNKISENTIIINETQSMKRIINDIQPIISNNARIDLNADFLSSYGVIEKRQVLHDNFLNKLGTSTTLSSYYTSANKGVSHLKAVYLDMNNTFCSRLMINYEPYADFMSVGIFVIKNNLDADNAVTFNLEKALETCDKAAAINASFPMVIFFNLK